MTPRIGDTVRLHMNLHEQRKGSPACIVVSMYFCKNGRTGWHKVGMTCGARVSNAHVHLQPNAVAKIRAGAARKVCCWVQGTLGALDLKPSPHRPKAKCTCSSCIKDTHAVRFNPNRCGEFTTLNGTHVNRFEEFSAFSCGLNLATNPSYVVNA